MSFLDLDTEVVTTVWDILGTLSNNWTFTKKETNVEENNKGKYE